MPKKTGRRLRLAAFAAAALFALPLYAPLPAGFLLARLGAAAERRLPARFSPRLRRGLSLAAVCVLGTGGLLGLRALPEALERALLRLFPAMQEGAAAALGRIPGAERFAAFSAALLDRAGRALLAPARLLRRLRPDAVSILAALLSAVLFTQKREALRARLSPALTERLDAADAALGRRLRAFGRRLPRLLAVFALSFLALRLSGVPAPAAAAGVLTLAEALPLPCAGLLLLPAALCAALLERRLPACVLSVLYLAILLTRVGCERPPLPAPPKLLAFLAAGCAGYRLGGAAGLLAGLAAVWLLAPALLPADPADASPS